MFVVVVLLFVVCSSCLVCELLVVACWLRACVCFGCWLWAMFV